MCSEKSFEWSRSLSVSRTSKVNSPSLFQFKSRLQTKRMIPAGKTAEDGQEFIRNKFLELTDVVNAPVYTLFTCVVSTENVQFVFRWVENLILENFSNITFERL